MHLLGAAVPPFSEKPLDLASRSLTRTMSAELLAGSLLQRQLSLAAAPKR